LTTKPQASKGLVILAAVVLTASVLIFLAAQVLKPFFRSTVEVININFLLNLPEPDEYLLHADERSGFPSEGMTATAVSYASLTDDQLFKIIQALPETSALPDVTGAVAGMESPASRQILSLLGDFSADAWVRGKTMEDDALYLAFDPQTGKAVLVESYR